MHSFSADPANFHYRTRIHPALTSFADEVCGTLARLFAYVMTLALLAIGAIALWEQLLDATTIEPSDKGASSLADRSSRAFAVSQFDLHEKRDLRHIPASRGWRKDLFHWRCRQKPVAELEIYRPGGELDRSGPAIADLATRMDPDGMREFEAAGVIEQVPHRDATSPGRWR
jgi:hypothetical protein